MAKIVFTRAPWWGVDAAKKSALAGVRAGSRGAMLLPTQSGLDRPVFGEYLPYPFELGYAAAYLAKEGDLEVRLRDSLATRESYEAYFTGMRAENPRDIIFESAPSSWDHDRKLIQQLHRFLPSARIILVGKAADMLPELTLGALPLAACVRGEYENGCKRAAAGESGLIDSAPLNTEQLNEFPIPYYDEWMARWYCDHIPFYHREYFGPARYPQGQLWSGRARGRNLMSPAFERLISDLTERFHFNTYHIGNEWWMTDATHIFDVSSALAKSRIPWSAEGQAATFVAESAPELRAAGCFGLRLHVTPSPLSEYAALRQTVVALKRVGMSIHAAFLNWSAIPADQRAGHLRAVAAVGFDTVQDLAASGLSAPGEAPIRAVAKDAELSEATA